jgi:hypothetical protein
MGNSGVLCDPLIFALADAILESPTKKRVESLAIALQQAYEDWREEHGDPLLDGPDCLEIHKQVTE